MTQVYVLPLCAPALCLNHDGGTVIDGQYALLAILNTCHPSLPRDEYRIETMTTASMSSTSASARRGQVMVGELPLDFLRLCPPTSSGENNNSQMAADEQAARALQQSQLMVQGGVAPQMVRGGGNLAFVPADTRGRLSITCVEARLNKNYGLVRMDPYCRIRVGHTVFETPTDVNGSKAPKWNRTVHCYLPMTVDSIFVELFDERAFTTDERIAWAQVLNCETSDDWYALTGQLGEAKEGLINLIFQFAPVDAPTVNYVPISSLGGGSRAIVVGGPPGAVIVTPQPPPQQADVPRDAPRFNDEDIAEMQEMFPNVDKEVIRSVMEEKSGNKEAAVTALLSIAAE